MFPLLLDQRWPWLIGMLLGGVMMVKGEDVAWTSHPSGRYRLLSIPKEGHTGFTSIPSTQSGILFSNHLADLSAGRNQVRMNGSGVALGDVDGDGWCDIYFCGLETPNRLYRNQGNWRFQDITTESGTECAGQYSTGAVFADVDGDGDLDLLVNGIGTGTRLLLNDGHGRFTPSTESGLQRQSGAMSMALADLDGDGDLDLYVTHYRTNTIRSTGYAGIVDGKGKVQPAYQGQYEVTPDRRLLEYGEADALYLNDGRGRFSQVSWTGGDFRDEAGQPLRAPPMDWGLSVMLRDLNGDGFADIYVCNDFWTPDRIWLNDGKGKFRAAPAEMLRHTSNSSMGMDVADLDRDGRDDFLVVDMLSREHARRLRQRGGLGQSPNRPLDPRSRPQIERNTLFWNQGDGTFAEIASLAGLDASEWSWSVICLDVDLDGFEDVLMTTGNLFDMMDDDMGLRQAAHPKLPLVERLLLAPRLNTPKMAFKNQGNWTFQETGEAWGFHSTGVAHGMAAADLDNDGDLDLVVNTLNAPAEIYRNDSRAPRVAVRLKGPAGNTAGVGARIELKGGPVLQSQVMMAGGRYLSGDDSVRVFAAGGETNKLSLVVQWLDGRETVVEEVKPNSQLELAYSSSVKPTSTSTAPPPSVMALFTEKALGPIATSSHLPSAKANLGSKGSRPLNLSRRVDLIGTSVGWFDLDGDGWEDLMVSDPQEEEPQIYLNDGKGELVRRSSTPTNAMSGLGVFQTLAFRESKGPAEILTLLESRDANSASAAEVLLREFSHNPVAIPGLTNLPSNFGAWAMADYNGDGRLDLWIAGHHVAGEYPRPSPSLLFRRTNSGWELDEENSRTFASAGLIQASVFTDLDADGDPDLLLACEWGPVRLFENRAGHFLEITELRGLNKFQGWWNGLAVADLDGDGLLDFVATNWGRNTPFESLLQNGFLLAYGDISGRGRFETVEGIFDSVSKAWVPWQDRRTAVRNAPWLQETFPTVADYASAPLEQIHGPILSRKETLKVQWLASTVFLNRESSFEARVLPLQAQISPAFGVACGDFDGDGRIDLFLAQNFFGMEESFARLDAGQGLLLHGLGDGNFKAMNSLESGIRMLEEQQSAAVADVNQDGRLDLVVGTRNGPPQLYLNQAAAPALRVRLEGPPGNASGVGTVVRPDSGASQEVHAGNGYRSQDTTVLLVGGNRPKSLTIRFPWKPAFVVPVPTSGSEIVVNVDRSTRVVKP